MSLLNEFELDNFMEKCFNAKENTYPEEGPGCGLEENKNLILCLKNVPKIMENQALKNILSNYGNIVSVSRMNDALSNLRFAVCGDVTSLEAVLRGMSKNEWNIEVSQKTEKKITSEPDLQLNVIPNFKSNMNATVTSTDENILRPSLTVLKYPEYINESKDVFYFQNKQITDYIYNSKNMVESIENINFDFIDVRNGEICKCSKTNKNIFLGNCYACGKYATKYCDRCKELYCSKECQSSDWSNHKYVCTEKPLLTRLKEESKIIEDPYKNLRGNRKNNEKIHSGQKILITHVEKSNLLFVRSVEKNEREDYIRIINVIASHAFSAKELVILPQPGTFVLAIYNNGWYRAIVLNSKNENEILIAYPDFGSTALKSMMELKEFPEDLVNLKSLVFCVCLKDVKDVVLNEKAKIFLYNLVDESVEMKIIYNEKESINDQPTVELIDLKTNQNVNKRLNVFINPVVPSIHEIPILLEDVAVIKFKPSKNIKLIILDNSFIEAGFITCILNKDADELEKMNNQIKEYAKQHSGFYTPRETEICLVKACDKPETWYRAICEVVSGNGKPIVSLLDYGTMCEVSIQNIRKCPKQLNLPCFTNVCYIKELEKCVKSQNIKNREKSKLQDILKLYDLITVPKVDLINNENYITLPKEIISRIKDNQINVNEED